MAQVHKFGRVEFSYFNMKNDLNKYQTQLQGEIKPEINIQPYKLSISPFFCFSELSHLMTKC